jgi:anthranilate phosphoribosyltransferase
MLSHYLHLLNAHTDLKKEQAEDAMNLLLETEDSEQIKLFLTALKEKGETSQEVIGMMEALQKKAFSLSIPCPTLDIVGTGGDLASTVNISTGSAILAAACGIPVTKLGNRSASSRSGSADVLESLGINLETAPEDIENHLNHVGIAFLFAAYYYPALKRLRTIRKELKFHTVFNLLGPLLNPANAQYSLIGVANEEALELLSKVLVELGNKKRVLVFYGTGPNGIILDELTPLGPIIAYDIHNGQRKRIEIDPLSLGLPPCSLADLQGGDSAMNSSILENVFKGKEGSIADTLVLNAATALWIFEKVSSIQEGISIARAALKEGKALRLLEKWKLLSSSDRPTSENYLDKILVDKRIEVEKLITETNNKPDHPLNKLLKEGRPCKNLFSKALKGSTLSVIAEVKRHSPSLGSIKEIKDPVDLALRYCKGGASAISVLTDEKAFKGSLEDLENVSKALIKTYPHVSTLRKDFIIHPLQLAQAALAGASAVLLIAYVLKKELSFFIKEAKRLGLETLTEIHDLQDLHYALDANAPIIGINHRNLRTFEIDLTLSKKLKPLLPSRAITVAESGIHTPEQAHQMLSLGYDAILVGEALVRCDNPTKLLSSMKQKKNATQIKICRVTHPKDADYAAKLGADYIGIIFSKKSKYPISLPQGKEIAKAAIDAGATPVAVFVDETLEEILSICKETNITTVQLHGKTSKEQLPFLVKEFTIFYVIPVNPDGSTSDIPSLPKEVHLLFDCVKAGSGKAFDWKAFKPPKDRPFILAGGLNPDNLESAIHLLHPTIVDVASGVEKEGTARKDPLLLKSFINIAKQGT